MGMPAVTSPLALRPDAQPPPEAQPPPVGLLARASRALFDLETPWQRIWLPRSLGKHDTAARFVANLQGILARLKTYFDDAADFGIEAHMITGRMNDALGALVDRDLCAADFSMDHWRGWYHTDGRLRGSSGHGN